MSSTPMLPDFRESELDQHITEKLSTFFSEVHKLRAQYDEHHSNETKFMDKCRELQGKVNVIQKERKDLTESSEETAIKIESIRSTISNTEIKNKELTRTLELKKGELTASRKENDRLHVDLENITIELEMEREELTKSLEKKIDHLFNTKNQEISKLSHLRTISSELFSSVKSVEKEKNEVIHFVGNLNVQIDETNVEIVNQKKKYKDLELEILNYENDLDAVSNELMLKKEMLNNQKEQLLSATNQVKEASNLVTENNIKLDSSQQCLECLEDELKMLNEDIVSMKEVTECQRNDVEHYNEEISKKLEAKAIVNRKLSMINSAIHKIEKETHSLVQTKEKWAQKCSDIKRDIKVLEAKITVFNKQFDASQRERELIESYHDQKCKSVQDVEIAIFTAESSIKNLDNEISSNVSMIKKLKKIIEELSADLKKNKYELFVKNNKLQKMELKFKKIESVEVDLQSKIAENEGLLKQQENLIEAVRLDKNVYNKSLIDQKEEMKVFKRNFNALNHSINQIKMELSEKDQMYITEHFNVDQVDKDVLIIRGKIEGINKKITQSDQYVDEILKHKLNELNKLIVKSDDILKGQYKEYNSIISESKNLSTNLIAKNNELGEIKESIRLLNSMFAKGNAAYNDKCKLLITSQQVYDNLAFNLDVVERNLEELEVLKSQILSMENDLLSENLKVQSLKDELCRPVNIHRWRQLKDTNPEIFKLIEKSHKLTKQLLTQNEQIYAKQQSIHEKEKLYVNLRKILARAPGNEAREQLNLYLQTLNEKKSKLKLLTNQLTIYQNKVHLLKHQINIMNKDKNGLKLQYFQIRKRQYTAQKSAQREREQQAMSAEIENESDKENVEQPPSARTDERDAEPQSEETQDGK